MSDKTDNKKTEQREMRDDFWDLDSMLPQSVLRQAPTTTDGPRDTEAVEIAFGEEEQDDARELHIPPMPNITSRMQRAAQYRNGAARNPDRSRTSPMPSHGNTPGDVSPQMAQPVCSYTPENSMIKQVSVFRWPQRYQYYERFTADAERYFNRTSAEVPFVNFFAYMPQYSQMSQDQLRWYLYWRDNVRHGVYLSTDYSYIFLYIYEILNLPEKIKPVQGLAILCDLWLAYREQFPRLDRYLGEWVCDYCLIHALPAPLQQLSSILPTLVTILTFREFYIHFNAADECPITPQLCDVLSTHNWRQSKYLTPDNRTVFETHMYASVLGALHHAWKTDPDFVSLLGFSEVQQSRNAFSGALCTYSCKRRIDVRYLSLSRSYQLKFILSDLFKLAENCIRAHYGIKARLNASGVPEVLKTYVKDYFARELPPPQKAPRKPVQTKAQKDEIARRQEESAYAALYEPLSTDLSPEAALALEVTSWANTELLVPEEVSAADTHPQAEVSVPDTPSPTEDVPPSAPPAAAAEEQEDITCDDPYENFVRHLNDLYYTALKHIICREQAEFQTLCQTAMLLPDAMIDAINELAVTYTDDTVIDPDGSFWILSDFYANDVMNAVIAREEDL
ncbi:MAG: TerB N-terminal domain-containing protein [Clostridia bacterium]|nr:TerB N-terminal domain-containing protein [Clostridia bacterium]